MVTSFGARIEQFTPSDLVAVFGIEPMEDAARRAVLASHAMLQTLRRSEDDKHGRFAIHLGSYLIARAGAVTGMDAHARRQATDVVNGLLQQAGPDEIVVDAAAARFLEPHFSMEGLADGPSNPARIVGRERPRFEAGGRTLSRFVGRAENVGTLHALMGRVEAGEAHVVGLAGEPGVGKSRLLFEVTHSPRVAGWLVLEAAAVSHGKATSYLPVTDLLRRYFGIGDRDTPRDVREKVTGRLLTLDRALEPGLPALLALLEVAVDDPRWRGLDPSGRRQRTLHAVTQLLVAGGARPACPPGIRGSPLDRRRDAGASGYPRRGAVRRTTPAAHQPSPGVSAGLGERDAVHRAPSGSVTPRARRPAPRRPARV